MKLIRYEDICLNTTNAVNSLMNFLDLPKNNLIKKFIEHHTQVTSEKHSPKKGKYNTKRNSSEVAFAWRKKSDADDVINVQVLCDKPMKTLGYIPIDNVIINKDKISYPVMIDKNKLDLYV